MTLRLNNKMVNGKEMNISIKLPFKDSDLSGQGSGTETAETGTKAKEMTVSLVVPFEYPQWLTEITEFAEAIDKTTGRRLVYRIGNEAADAMKFYQACFSGELNVIELTDPLAWKVSFSMREKLSVPERKQQRDELSPAQQQSLGGDTNSEEAEENDNIPPNANLSGFERTLAYMDSKLGEYVS